MWLVLALIVFVWVAKRNTDAGASVRSSSATGGGGWYSPRQTLGLGGWNLTGNQFDNNTVVPVLRSQSSGNDVAPQGMVYAVSGGQDGQNPALPSGLIGSTEVTTLPRFRMIGGGDPRNLPVVPVNVSTLNDKVRRFS